jgi:FKBP-type peptidyl-prolyl cis-trans isomerase FkpA/FKBP-type peptidyl-prolyl cis-trans isomerase FklB
MNKKFLSALCGAAFLAASLSFVACEPLGAPGSKAVSPKSKLDTEAETLSYGFGMNFGSQLGMVFAQMKQQGVELDTSVFLRGLVDKASGGPTLMTDSALQAFFTEYGKKQQEEMRKKAEEQRQKDSVEAVASKQAAADFLAKNKAEAGVVSLPSGIQYIVLTPGTGASPTDSSTISMHYVGTLLDGTEFDNSRKHNPPEPLKFTTGRVIKGWAELVKLMKPGEKIKAWIPADLAYGDRRQNKIPPGSLLVFEMELVGFDK